MSAVRNSSSGLEALAARIGELTGLSFPASRLEDFAAGIGRVMEQYPSEDVEDLAGRLQDDPRLLDAVIAEVTVGETYFFRDPDQFEAIRTIVLPSLLQDRPASARLKIWSAGCSTGEEPYSIAIFMEQEGVGDRVRITATDISRTALKAAQAAEYCERSFRNGAAENLSRYFSAADGSFRLSRRIRQRVRYEFLNLASDTFPAIANGTAALDLILCRNVLIYFESDAVRRVAGRLFDCLAPGGWLLIGPSDPPLWDHAPFETTITPAGVLYRRPSKAAHPVSRIRSGLGPDPHALQPSRQAAEERIDADSKSKQSAAARRQPRTQPPEDANATASRIRALADRGELQAAEEIAAEAVQRHPLSPELYYLQSLVFMAGGRKEEAVAALRRVIYLDRTLAAAHFLLGSVLESSEPAAARRAFANAAALLAGRPSGETVPLTRGDTAGALAEIAKGRVAALRNNSGA